MIFFLIFIATFLFNFSSWACSPPENFICDLDLAPYLYKFEPQVKTTLPAGTIKARQRTTHYDVAREQFEIEFDIKSDLYTLDSLKSKEVNIATPLKIDGTYFKVQSKIRTNGETSCELRDSEEPNLENLDKLDWNCDEMRGGCEEIMNPNFMVLSPYQFKFPTKEMNFPTSPNKLKSESSRLKKYVLYNGQIHSIEVELRRLPNLNYLKMNCPSDVKITSCGKRCRELNYTDSQSSTDEKRQEPIRGIGVVEFPRSKSKFSFDYDLIPGSRWNRDYYVKEMSHKFNTADYKNSMNSYDEIPDEALDAVTMLLANEYASSRKMKLKVKRLK